MRLIAKLDVKPPNVVKPVHFEGLRKIGEPAYLAQKYYEEGADEVVYLDIVASLYRRDILLHHVQRTAENIFIPFTVGGGVSSLEECSALFRHGADKVAINTFAVQSDPSIIDRAAKVFGSQSVVVNIEAKTSAQGWACYSDCGRVPSNRSVTQWVKEVEDRGAGEILLQSIDCDGRQRGFDLELVHTVVDLVSVPVVACSGAGSLDDIIQVAVTAKPSAIAIASVLHYEKLTFGDIRACLRERIAETIS